MFVARRDGKFKWSGGEMNGNSIQRQTEQQKWLKVMTLNDRMLNFCPFISWLFIQR